MAIDVERLDSTAVVTVNRPDALNALDLEHARELRDRLAQLAEDDGARVVVLTGAGERAFVAGELLEPGAELARVLEVERVHRLRPVDGHDRRAVPALDDDRHQRAPRQPETRSRGGPPGAAPPASSVAPSRSRVAHEKRRNRRETAARTRITPRPGSGT